MGATTAIRTPPFFLARRSKDAPINSADVSGALTMVIADDGQGFDTDEVAAGQGQSQNGIGHEWNLMVPNGFVPHLVTLRHAAPSSCSRRWASPTATAVILTMPRAVIEGVSICAGLAAPSKIGPTGKASAMVLVI